MPFSSQQPVRDRVRLALASAGLSIVIPLALLAAAGSVAASFQSEHHTRAEMHAIAAHRVSLRLVFTDLMEAETGQRGFLLTGREDFLAPYLRARAELPGRLKKLEDASRTSDNKLETARLKALASAKIAELEQTVRLVRSGRRAQALDIVASGDGQRLTDQVRNIAYPSWAKDDAALARLTQDANAAERATVTAGLGCGALILLCLISGISVIHSALRARGKAARDAIKAQQAAAFSEARYRRLAETGNDIVTEFDLDGRFRYLSPAVERITGYSVDEVLERPANSFVHPDDQARVEAEIKQSITSEGGRLIEFRHICKDGRVIWMESRPQIARDPATGKAVAVTDVIRDVTDRRAAQDALARSEGLYRLLADNAADVILQRPAGGGPGSYVSPSIQKLLGYTPEEFLSREAMDHVVAEDLPRVLEDVRRLCEGEPDVVCEFRLIASDGREVWVESRPKLGLRGGDGPPEIFSIIRDITERKALEAELRAATAAAEQAAAVKSEFLSNMSHELRTPLTSIIGFSAFLAQEATLSAVGQRAVDRVTGSSKALLTIVNDILDFSKLESGHIEIDRCPVDLDRTLAEAVDLLDPQAQAKGLALNFTFRDPPHGQVLLDAARVRQVLLNLVGNAVKFTSTGSVSVEARYDPAAERLHCEVTDTGPGIAASQQHRLFQRFSQVDGSATRTHGGTGLGLAICKGLIEAMGGVVGVRSEVGLGATFWFDLEAPLFDCLADGLDGAASDLDLSGLRVLAVDDNAVNLELVRRLLEGRGVDLDTASSGEEALRIAALKPFDVILMDLRMPGLDGVAATLALKRGPGPNDVTPVIAFSANRPAEHEIEAAGLFDGEVTKPIVPSALLAEVARCVWPQQPLEAANG